MKPRYDANGTLWFCLVLPSRSLRSLVYRRLRKAYPELNYCCEWKDTEGYGISMTVAEGMNESPLSIEESRTIYHVPD